MDTLRRHVRVVGLMKRRLVVSTKARTKGRSYRQFLAVFAPTDAATLLTFQAQDIATRWFLSQRAPSLEQDGERLLDREIALFRPRAPLETTA